MTRERFVREFDRFITKGSSLAEFEIFVIENLSEALRRDDEDAVRTLFDAADVCLVRLGLREINEQELVERVEAEIRHTETQTIVLSQEIVTFSVESKTVHSCAVLNESVSSVRQAWAP